MTVHIAHVAPITLSGTSPFLRVAPSLAIDASQMDFKTLAHDVFSSAGRTILSGPRLFDLKGFLKGKFLIDGMDVSRRLRTSEHSRHQRMVIPIAGYELSVSALGENWTLPINPDGNAIFAGKRVIFTLSKNNSLEWIRDWVMYYATNHGINGVLIYDNNSDAYTVDELAKALSDIEEVEIVIVPWPFKFGHGRRATGQQITRFAFCQRGAWENAHFRFLSRAAWVIDPDIDELLVFKGGSIARELALHPKSIGLSFNTRRISPVTWNADTQSTSFVDYFHSSAAYASGNPKWVIVPERVATRNKWLRVFLPEAVWETHRMAGLKKIHNSTTQYFAHFSAINTGWKDKKRHRESVAHDPSKHVLDDALVEHLLKAFPNRMKTSLSRFKAAMNRRPPAPGPIDC
jgi:hypothetical protein